MSNTVSSSEKPISKRLMHIGIALAILVVFWFLPIDESALPTAGRMALGLLIAAVYMWVTDPIPMGVTALLVLIVMPAFGIMSYTDVWSNWVSGTLFFVMASFGLTKAITKSNIPIKIVTFLMRLTKAKSSLVVLTFMIASAFVSAWMSNIPVTAIFCAFAISTILETQNATPGKSKLGICLMIGIVYGTMFGGMLTPVGNPMNIMVSGILTSNYGITISFLQWVCMALPLVVIALPVSWFVLTRVYKPEAITEETRTNMENKAKESGPLNAYDKKVLIIFAALIVLWMTSSITGLDATAICVFGLIVMFLPGVDVLTWQEFVDSVAWNIVMIIGSVSSLAAGVNKNGAGSWLVTSAASTVSMSASVFLAGSAAFLPIARLVVPVAPAMIALVAVPFLGLAQELGISVALMAMIIALEVNTFLLALDNNTMMSYRYGYYSIIQYFLVGIIPTIAIWALCVFLLPNVVGLLGL